MSSCIFKDKKTQIIVLLCDDVNKRSNCTDFIALNTFGVNRSGKICTVGSSGPGRL